MEDLGLGGLGLDVMGSLWLWALQRGRQLALLRMHEAPEGTVLNL